MKAADVMEKSIICVSPELGLKDFEELLTREEISGAPVTGSGGRAVGIATKSDIVSAISQVSEGQEPWLQTLTVEDVMTRDIISVEPNTSVRDIAQLMIDGHLHRVLVVEESEILGIVSSFDLLRFVQ